MKHNCCTQIFLKDIPNFEIKNRGVTAELIVIFSVNPTLQYERKILIEGERIDRPISLKHFLLSVFDVIYEQINMEADKLGLTLSFDDALEQHIQKKIENAFNASLRC